MLNGIVDRYPGARIILAHAGGFLPYASHRFAELARVFRPDAANPADILASFQRFYFDTALSSGPAALPSLKAFAGSGRILFGSDFPYAPADVAASFTAKLDAYDGLTADEHRAISHRQCVDPVSASRPTAQHQFGHSEEIEAGRRPAFPGERRGQMKPRRSPSVQTTRAIHDARVHIDLQSPRLPALVRPAAP